MRKYYPILFDSELESNETIVKDLLGKVKMGVYEICRKKKRLKKYIFFDNIGSTSVNLVVDYIILSDLSV